MKERRNEHGRDWKREKKIDLRRKNVREREREKGRRQCLLSWPNSCTCYSPLPPKSQHPSDITACSNVSSWHWLGSLVVVGLTRERSNFVSRLSQFCVDSHFDVS